MRAVVYDTYGPPEVLGLAGVARPVPKDNEVLIRTHATTVNRPDCGWRSGQPFFVRASRGRRRPQRRILGSELAGEVAGVGPAVSAFAVGDEVFGVSGFGAHGEWVCVREDRPLTHKPAGMPFEEAAAVCDGVMSALSCLSKADLPKGRSLLIYGASGSIGTAAVQLAKKAFDATVTAVCSTKHVELVRSLGADRIIDYTQEDFTTNGQTYDVIFDAVGKTSFRRCRRVLKPGGLYIETDLGFLWHVPLLVLLTRRIGDRRGTVGGTPDTQPHVPLLKELIEAGKDPAVIHPRYPIGEGVEATRDGGTGHKIGNVGPSRS